MYTPHTLGIALVMMINSAVCWGLLGQYLQRREELPL